MGLETTVKTYISAIILSIALVACGEANVIDSTSTHVLPLPDSKSDNYVSTNAREFEVRGTAHARLPESYDSAETPEAKQKILDETVSSRLSIVVRSVKKQIQTVLRVANGGTTKDDDSWFIYVKSNAGERQTVTTLEDGRLQFSFKLELVGSYYLMSKVAPGTSPVRRFKVLVQGWTASADDETIEVEIEGSDSRDAFPKYNEMFSDGVLDMAVHFGGDYNKERLDIDTCKWLVEELHTNEEWTNTHVSKFEDLKIDSPPFIRKLTVEGKEIEMRMYIYHSDMVEPAEEEKLSLAMKASMKERDIIVYSGHAGSGSGFILDYQPKHEIKAADFATLDLPSKYQIFVFDGCRTYRTYVDDMMKNPNKTFDNIDIVTTVNTTPFGAGYYLLWELTHWLTITNDQGAHFPLSWMSILRGVNRKRFKSVHYGVHGIDNNPKVNPHKSDGIACKPCEADNECGAGGNLCLGYPLGSSCGIACTTDTACPDGYRCARIIDDPNYFYLPKQCVRQDYRCEGQ